MDKKDNNMTMYIAAAALFISVITVIFFYREIKKIKKDITDIKQIKNQLVNIDTRFDLVDNSFEEINKFIKNSTITEGIPERDHHKDHNKDHHKDHHKDQNNLLLPINN